MNAVEPIRDPYILKCIAEDLKRDNERNYMIFLCALYTGRRISDVLSFKVSDLKNKDFIYIRESKTGKKIYLPINDELKYVLASYLENRKTYEYVFPSPYKNKTCMHRSTFYKILNEEAKKYGLERIGCHTMRKTFGYHYYQKFKDAVTLMEIFGHADINITLRYIGINQEVINKTMKNFKIF